jgi:hypothetical protein
MGFFDTLRLTIWWFLRSVTVFQPQSRFFSLGVLPNAPAELQEGVVGDLFHKIVFFRQVFGPEVENSALPPDDDVPAGRNAHLRPQEVLKTQSWSRHQCLFLRPVS